MWGMVLGKQMDWKAKETVSVLHLLCAVMPWKARSGKDESDCSYPPLHYLPLPVPGIHIWRIWCRSRAPPADVPLCVREFIKEGALHKLFCWPVFLCICCIASVGVNWCTGKEKCEIKSVVELEKLNTPFSCMRVISKQGLASSQNLDQDNFRSYPKMKLNFSLCWTWWQKSSGWWREQDQTTWWWLASCPHSHRYFFSVWKDPDAPLGDQSCCSVLTLSGV